MGIPGPEGPTGPAGVGGQIGLYTNTSIVYPHPLITADCKAPEVSPSGLQGWYFKNTTAGTKINWYIPPPKTISTVADIKGLYFSFYNGLTTSKNNTPFLTIYTKVDGATPNYGNFYKSNRTYTFQPTPVANTYYTAFLNKSGSCPDPVYYNSNLVSLVKTSSEIGPFADNEVIYAFTIGTNSESAQNSAELVMQKFGVVTESTTQEFVFMIPVQGATGPTGPQGPSPTNQTYNGSTTTFAGVVNATSFVKSGATSSDFLKGDGSVDSKSYMQSSSVTNSAVPYINATGAVSSSVTNLYVQKGVNTIQSAIDSISSGVAYSIQLSAGGFTENITLTKQNYMLSGAKAPLFAPSTQVTGNITIGSTTVLTTRIKISDIQFVGDLKFESSATNQELRTTVSNCEFTGSVTLPTAAVTGTWIYFFDCSFSGTTPIIFNNLTCPMVFTRCNFNGQPMTNNLATSNYPYLIFRDCTGLASLSLGNSIQFGINALTTGDSRVTAGGFKTIVPSTGLLKADGTVTNGTITNMCSGYVDYVGANTTKTGTGYTVTKNMTGEITIVVTAAFTSQPSFTVSLHGTAYGFVTTEILASSSNNQFKVRTFNSSYTLADFAFSFIVLGN